jgi:mannitol-1-phosphate 5-dehydrogenase
MSPASILIFGAGNIGRSFIGQLFSRAGYRVVFVDVNASLVEELNRRRSYLVEIKGPQPETIHVENVSAIHGNEHDRVAEAVAGADLLATAVGPGALPHLYPVLAAGLLRRRGTSGPPLDIILCENLRHAAALVADGLRPHLPADFSLSDYLGLVETSIGKMVPIMPEEARAKDLLLLYAEAYNTLLVDARAFRNPIPNVPGLDPKQNMAAYVDRKSFVHNLGHAASAYLGHLRDPEAVYVWQVLAHAPLRRVVKQAMWESGRALMLRYPGEFTERDQEEHIEDLLTRFANQALGDTIFRVGRDLPRKLSREDRLVGALLMDAQQGVDVPATTLAVAAGLLFRATDEHGQLFAADAQFARDLAVHGPDWILTHHCGLTATSPVEAQIREDVRQYHRSLESRGPDWLTVFLGGGC